jgi:hypothetical protein
VNITLLFIQENVLLSVSVKGNTKANVWKIQILVNESRETKLLK